MGGGVGWVLLFVIVAVEDAAVTVIFGGDWKQWEEEKKYEIYYKNLPDTKKIDE